MTRSRKSAREAGTKFESSIATYLAEHVDDRIERRTKSGARDRGDMSGLRLSPALRGGRVVVEAKDYGGRLLPAAWTSEAETERGHDDAVAGVVVAKRKGVTDPGEQWVLMTMRDFVALVTGTRPEET